MSESDETRLAQERADLERASYEVDLTLLRWFRSLPLRERLRAATRTARMLGRFRRADRTRSR